MNSSRLFRVIWPKKNSFFFQRTIIHSTEPAQRARQRFRKKMDLLKERFESDIITGGGRHQAHKDSCVFCSIARGKDVKNKILFQNSEVSVFYDFRPAAKEHLLIIPNTHMKTAKTLDENDLPKVQYMYEVGKAVLEQLNGNVESARCGFHWPPFHSIEHLHLHMIHKESDIGFIQRQVFKPNSLWFATYDWVLQWLERKKQLATEDDTST